MISAPEPLNTLSTLGGAARWMPTYRRARGSTFKFRLHKGSLRHRTRARSCFLRGEDGRMYLIIGWSSATTQKCRHTALCASRYLVTWGYTHGSGGMCKAHRTAIPTFEVARHAFVHLQHTRPQRGRASRIRSLCAGCVQHP